MAASTPPMRRITQRSAAPPTIHGHTGLRGRGGTGDGSQGLAAVLADSPHSEPDHHRSRVRSAGSAYQPGGDCTLAIVAQRHVRGIMRAWMSTYPPKMTPVERRCAPG